MAVRLKMVDESLDADALHALTLDLCSTIRRDTDVQADLLEGDAGAGTKGDPVTLGTIALAFISSGAAVALFEVVKSYFQREPSLEVEVQGDDGASFKLNARNLSRQQFDKALGIVGKASGDA